MAHEIAERNSEDARLALVGIRTHGVPLAQRLAGILAGTVTHEVPTGALDIGMPQDDIALRGTPRIGASQISFDVTGKTIVLVEVRHELQDEPGAPNRA